MYEHFRGFYDDVFPEFAKAGSVVQFKVRQLSHAASAWVPSQDCHACPSILEKAKAGTRAGGWSWGVGLGCG